MGQCVTCTRDLQDGYQCHACKDKLVEDLVFLAWYVGELFITKTRQARVAGSSGGDGRPLGFQPGASKAYDSIQNNLGGWVRDLHSGREQWPSDTPASMALWLAHRGDRMRLHPAVDELTLDVKRHSEKALELINPLADEQTYGICGEELPNGASCTAYLYGAPKADWVRCKACHTQHDARQRMKKLEQRMRVLYFRAATLARILPRLFDDRPVSASNIRNWYAQGQPIKIRTDEDDHLEYHCGDVIEVAKKVAKRDRPRKAG